jgi:lipoteichoic acid synthase
LIIAPQRLRRRSRLPWFVLAAVLAAAFSVSRATYLESFAGSYTGCSGCFLLPTLAQDAWVIALICALLAAAAASRARVLRVLFGTVAALLCIGMALDSVLLRLFTQRFYVADLWRFGAELTHDWSVARDQFFSLQGVPYCVAVVLLVVVIVGVLGARASRMQALLLAGAGTLTLLFAVVATVRAPLHYVHSVYTDNLIVANLPQGREKPFSSDYAQHQLQQADAEPRICTRDAPSGRSVIIVITESLSAYQSALLGGPRDWLPQLDTLARSNHYFTHFYANGFGTDGGEIAALTGRLPAVPPGASWYALKQFGAGDDTLVGVAHRAGYSAHYFTTADLSFLDSGTWLRELGFDSVEGNEATFYRDQLRGQFGAPPDAALFARFEEWLAQRDGSHPHDDRPFIAVLLTVSSHPPFVDPRSGKQDPRGAFGYVDEQLAAFHAHLAASGFLDHGVLLITGDHRSMTPLDAHEYRRFGERAFARIPLIVAGAVDMPPVVDAAFQQSDLPASVARLVGADYCRSAFTGTLLDASPAPPRYVLHTRGDDRNRVDVYFDGDVAGYAEDGDASHWIDAKAPPDAQSVAAWIDAQRVRNGAAPVKR